MMLLKHEAPAVRPPRIRRVARLKQLNKSNRCLRRYYAIPRHSSPPKPQDA